VPILVHWGRGGIAPFILNHGTRSGWVVISRLRPHLPPGKSPVPILQEVGWAPEPVWTQRLEEKSSASVGDWNPAIQLVVRHYTDWTTRLTYCICYLLWETRYMRWQIHTGLQSEAIIPLRRSSHTWLVRTRTSPTEKLKLWTVLIWFSIELSTLQRSFWILEMLGISDWLNNCQILKTDPSKLNPFVTHHIPT
jgi:hypothetical protein